MVRWASSDPDERSAGLTRREVLRRGAAFGAFAALPSLLAACGGDEGPGAADTTGGGAGTQAGGTTEAAAGAPRAGGTFRLATSDGGSSETLDPQAFVSATDQLRTLNIWDRLCEVQADNTVEMWLAESVEPETAGEATSWIVKLRPGVTFHDGKDLTADDVLWTLQRLLREDAPYFSAVDPFVDGNQLAKIDDLTVRIGLKQPYGDFTRYLANRYLHILPDGADSFTTPEECIGTGPFRLTEWTAGERALLEKNPSWWREGPYLDRVEMLGIPQESQLNALLAGQLDGTEGFATLAQALQLQDNPAVQLFTLPGANVPNFTMRLDAKPFDDVRVREAFRLAIDRQKIIDTLYSGQGSLGNDLHGKPFPSYNSDLPQRPYDPEQAKALLAEAGYPDGIEVELVTGLFPDHAAAYAETARAAGITISLKKVPSADVYNTDLYYLKAPFTETSWGADSFEFIAPQGYVSNAPFNETAWQRPDWDTRFYDATGIVEDDERNAVYKELQTELYEEGGYIIWAYGDTLYAGNPKLRGVVEQVPGFIWNDSRFEMLWLEA
jgi:peptide/nickel transport system substrate-binding protein